MWPCLQHTRGHIRFEPLSSVRFSAGMTRGGSLAVDWPLKGYRPFLFMIDR
jgi:hypothetical protein